MFKITPEEFDVYYPIFLKATQIICRKTNQNWREWIGEAFLVALKAINIFNPLLTTYSLENFIFYKV